MKVPEVVMFSGAGARCSICQGRPSLMCLIWTDVCLAPNMLFASEEDERRHEDGFVLTFT